MNNRTNAGDEGEFSEEEFWGRWQKTYQRMLHGSLGDVIEIARQAGATFTPDKMTEFLKAVASVCDVEKWDYTNRLKISICEVAEETAPERSRLAYLKIDHLVDYPPHLQGRYMTQSERGAIIMMHEDHPQLSYRDLSYITDRSISSIHELINTAESTERTDEPPE